MTLNWDHYAPSKYTFDWKAAAGHTMEVDPIPLPKESEFHSPIDYTASEGWGTGAPIRTMLTAQQQKLYDDVVELQDKRGDYGHADTVIYFTSKLADILRLSPSDKDVAICAAILHDVGWSKIDNIRAVFKELVMKQRVEDSEEKSLADAAMKKLRVLHQDEAVKVARTVLADHPRLDDICEAIGDHDTRYHVPRPEIRAFWDGDVLWRVTLTSITADTFGGIDVNDPDAVFSALCSALHRDAFALPWAYEIARRELIHTVLRAQQKFSWGRLPAHFCSIFGAGILLETDE